MIEPNPSLFNALDVNSSALALWRAVGPVNGNAALRLSDNDEASGLYGIAMGRDCGTVLVPCTTLESLIEELGLGEIDLIKMDVEGAEGDLLLRTPKEYLHSVAQLTVEFHSFCGLISMIEVEKIFKRLENLNFASIRWDSEMGNVLFVNRSKISRSRIALLAKIIAPLRRQRNLLRFRYGLNLLP